MHTFFRSWKKIHFWGFWNLKKNHTLEIYRANEKYVYWLYFLGKFWILVWVWHQFWRTFGIYWMTSAWIRKDLVRWEFETSHDQVNKKKKNTLTKYQCSWKSFFFYNLGEGCVESRIWCKTGSNPSCSKLFLQAQGPVICIKPSGNLEAISPYLISAYKSSLIAKPT